MDKTALQREPYPQHKYEEYPEDNPRPTPALSTFGMLLLIFH
ncbi:MAG: hypothetical protein U5K69_01410 [Balneolaceae bacterium]|nr:hypothetical protein [Balneolaceae bacterium]